MDHPSSTCLSTEPGADMQVMRKHALALNDDTRESGFESTLTLPNDYADHVRGQLALLGEDPAREGLLKTPERVATAMQWLTRGYGLSAWDVVGDAVFAEEHSNMVLVRDIEMYSMCEHHMLPFFGTVHIAYIPDGKIVGLSKLPRIVEV